MGNASAGAIVSNSTTGSGGDGNSVDDLQAVSQSQQHHPIADALSEASASVTAVESPISDGGADAAGSSNFPNNIADEAVASAEPVSSDSIASESTGTATSPVDLSTHGDSTQAAAQTFATVFTVNGSLAMSVSVAGGVSV